MILIVIALVWLAAATLCVGVCALNTWRARDLEHWQGEGKS